MRDQVNYLIRLGLSKQEAIAVLHGCLIDLKDSLQKANIPISKEQCLKLEESLTRLHLSKD